jgi:hypothetical protein
LEAIELRVFVSAPTIALASHFENQCSDGNIVTGEMVCGDVCRTYANWKRVNRPSTASTLGVVLAESAEALVAVKPHHASFEKWRDEAIGEARR